MIWHGGISGSSLIKVSEEGHLKELITDKNTLAQLPDTISFSDTVFSSMNLFVTLALFIILPMIMYLIAKRIKPTSFSLNVLNKEKKHEKIRYLNQFVDITVYQSNYVFNNMHPYLGKPEKYAVIHN